MFADHLQLTPLQLTRPQHDDLIAVTVASTELEKLVKKPSIQISDLAASLVGLLLIEIRQLIMCLEFFALYLRSLIYIHINISTKFVFPINFQHEFL